MASGSCFVLVWRSWAAPAALFRSFDCSSTQSITVVAPAPYWGGTGAVYMRALYTVLYHHSLCSPLTDPFQPSELCRRAL